MSSVLPVITYGGGDLLREFFNAVVVSLGDSSFKTLMRLALLLGGLWALLEAMGRRNLMLNIKWVCTIIVVTQILFVPKISVEIIDRTQSGKIYAVDRVPLGLAVLANITSVIGDSLTELTEKNFSLPDDLRYGKTGMVFASQLVTEASQFQITDPTFAASLQSYVQQCVFYDLLLKKYTLNELLNTPQLWVFLKDHSSPARAFLYHDQVTICRNGVASLDHGFQTAVQEVAARYAPQVLSNTTNAKANLLKYLQIGYGYLTSISDQGAQILQQNLLASSLQEGLQHFAASTNSMVALESYALAKAQMQKRMSNQTIGDMAAYWLPLMKTCFEGILYGAFIFVFLLAYFPFGLSVLKNYVASLLWVQLWAPLYAIINMIVSFYAHSKSITLVNGGLSVSALGGLEQVNADMAGLAGYLSLSVPFIAWGLVKGMGSTFTQLAQFIGGVTQSTAVGSAQEAVTGNLSVGNTQFANHSQWNTNAHHVDTNARYAAGMASLQTSSGSTLSITPSGTEIMDNRAALSNLGVSVNVAESIRAAASTQSQMSETAGLNQVHAAAEHYSVAIRELDDLAHHQGSAMSSGHSMTQTESSGLSRSAQTVSQLVDSFAKEHHVSHERAAQVLGQVYADTKVGGGFIVKGEVGSSISASSSGRSAFGGLYNDAHRFAIDHHFSETVDSAKRNAQESHMRESQDSGDRHSHAIANSFDRGDTLRSEAASSFSRAESFSKLASVTQEHAASINANYTQEFYEWIRAQPAIIGQGKLSHSAIENMAVHDPALLQDYAHRFVQAKASQTLNTFQTTHPQTEQGINVAFQRHNKTMHDATSMDQDIERFRQQFAEASQKANIKPVNTAVADEVETHLQSHAQAINTAKTQLEAKEYPLQTNIREKVQGKVLESLKNTSINTRE